MNTTSPVTKLPFEDFYKQNTGLVHRVARKVHARLLAIGAAVQFEDVQQEATIAMMLAYERFDPSLGFKFSTYYVRSAYNNLNRFMASYEKDCSVLGVFSMQAAVDDSGDMVDMESTIDGHHPSPEQMLETKQMLEGIKARLSPLAGTILEYMIDPPEAFEAEWKLAKSLRLKGTNVSTEVTMNFIGEYLRRLIGATQVEVKLAIAEVQSLAKEMNV